MVQSNTISYPLHKVSLMVLVEIMFQYMWPLQRYGGVQCSGFTLPPLSDGHTHVGLPCVHSCTRNKFVAVKVSHYKQCCPTILTHSSCDSLVCSHMQTVVFVQATMKWNWEWVFSSQVYCRADSFNHCCLPITHVATDSLIWCVHDLGTGVSSWLSAYSLAVLLKVMCKTSCWK